MDIFSVAENQKQALRSCIASAPESLSSASDDEIVNEFINKFKVQVPILEEATMTTSQREVDMDVSGDPRRMFFNPGPFFVKATEVTVHVPFSGESVFFDVRPSTFTLSPPRGLVQVGELLLSYVFPNDSPHPDLRRQLDSDLQSIKEPLERLRESSVKLRAELLPIAQRAWQQRKLQFTARSQVIAGLGLPRHTPSEPLPSAPPNSSFKAKDRKRTARQSLVSTGSQPANAWKVFISHASEDKQSFAKPLADRLIMAGLSVWYDDYTLSIGDSLRQKIDEGLAKSEFGIVILSTAFFAKHWPQQELNGLAVREQHGKKVILPVWHNISQDEVAQESPVLADRLGVSTALGMEHVVKRLLQAMNNSSTSIQQRKTAEP